LIKGNLTSKILGAIIIGVVSAVVVGYYFKGIKVKYISNSKIFPLSTSGVNSSGIVAQLTGGSSSGEGVFYNVEELIKSNTLSRQVVNLKSPDVKNPKFYLWLIDDYNKTLNWQQAKIELSKDTLQNIIRAADLFKANTLIIPQKNEFTKIQFKAGNEALALFGNECILKALKDFYIATKTEKARFDLDNLRHLRDSLKIALVQVERAELGYQDQNEFLSKKTPLLPALEYARLKEEISELYHNTAITYQNASFKLLNESPIFQVLDYPTAPVDVVTSPWKKFAGIAFILGVLLGLLIAFYKPIITYIKNELI
jgi:hypothetical protein